MIKEPSRFYSLVQLYASLLKELVLAAVKKCKGELLSTDVVNLKTFSAFEPVVLGTDCTLHMAELSLVTPTECQLMQVNITKVPAYTNFIAPVNTYLVLLNIDYHLCS